MKYLKQLLIIVAFSFAGELLHSLIPLSIPASIYGLVLLFVALLCEIVKLPNVKETAHFLIEIMPIMFIPAGVGLIESQQALQEMLLPAIVIMIVSTILVMGAAGKVTQLTINHEQKRQEGVKNEFFTTLCLFWRCNYINCISDWPVCQEKMENCNF